MIHTASHYVRQFHRAFGHPAPDEPTIPTPKQRLLRVRLIAEELLELAMASGVPFEYKVGNEVEVKAEVDLIGVADAVGDLDYVVAGTYVCYGLPAYRVFMEVHDSNMSKLGVDGKPIWDEHHKVVKGPNYRKPDLAKVLNF